MSATLPDLCHELGITYRQADYWIRRGWVVDDPDNATPGSGRPRGLSRTETARLEHMARLVRAGMHPQAAAANARRHVEDGPQRRDLELAWYRDRGECA